MPQLLAKGLVKVNQLLNLIVANKVYKDNTFLIDRLKYEEIVEKKVDNKPSFINLELNWVVGNEAADLDSVVSVISYSCIHNLFNLSNTDGSTKKVLSVPLINVLRQDLDLRPDIKHLLSVSQINLDDLLFTDDTILTNFISTTYVNKFVLMDHNKIHPTFNLWNPKIVKIIDHHKDEGFHTDLEYKLINDVGSNTSNLLLWYQFKQLSLDQILETYTDLNLFLLAPILIDTVNLKGSYGRCTDTDLKLANSLLANINKDENSNYSFDHFFKLFDGIKSDNTGLTLLQLFKKDFKVWNINNFELGISSIINFNFLDWKAKFIKNNNSDIVNSLIEFSTSFDIQLDIFLVMLSKNVASEDDSSKETFTRELVLYCKDKNLFNYLNSKLLNLSEFKIQTLSGGKRFENEYVGIYSLGNVKVSRKILLPTLKQVLLEYKVKSPL